MDQDDQSIKYIALYGFLYLLTVAIIAVLSSIFRTFFFFAITSLIISAYTVTKFVKQNSRPLTPTEKIKIICGASICTLAVNILRELLSASIDGLKGHFFAGQILQLLGIVLIFGTNYIYDSMKKPQKPQF
jgi:hypothetical protein